MADKKAGIAGTLSIAALVTAAFLGASTYLLSAYREENANRREYVARHDDAETVEEVARKCVGLPPASAADCRNNVEAAQEQTQHERADLKAQQDVAEWTFATFLAGCAGVIASAGALWALFWTFREQRKLTINQSRSYLELITAHYTAARWGSIDEGEDTEDQIDVTLTLINNGATPALRIKADLVLLCTPEHGGGETGASSYEITGISGELSEIPAKGTYVLRATGRGKLPHPTVKNGGWRYISPTVTAVGKVVFSDVFGGAERELVIKLEAPDIPKSWNEPPVEFYGAHRSRHGTERMLSHEKARYEQMLADARKAKADAEA